MINLGLKRTTRLLQHVAQDLLNQPQFIPTWKVIHIAGTNGKGSVAAYLSSILRRTVTLKDGSEIRIGRFTSPHFIDRWDCITINDETVARNLFETVEHQVKTLGIEVAKELHQEAAKSSATSESVLEDEKQERAEPTEFELLTATAFAVFSLPQPKPCDIAIIECGLGGRLDATNTLPDSCIEVSIITRIGLDHLNMLGGSLESIVREKCGIFRPNTAIVVDGQNDKKVLDLIDEQIHRKSDEASVGQFDARLLHTAYASDLLKFLNSSESETAEPANNSLFPLFHSLLPHQESNLCVALEAWNILKSSFVENGTNTGNPSLETGNHYITTSLVEDALRDAAKSYPARLQLLQPGWLNPTEAHNLPRLNETTVLLDGAHNEQSALVLREFVERTIQRHSSPSHGRAGAVDSQINYGNVSEYTEYENARPVIWILALSSTKPPTEILKALLPATEFIHQSGAVDSPKSQSPSKPQIFFTSFGPVDNMPWAKSAPLADLVQAAESVGLAPYVHAPAENIVSALDAVEASLNEYEKNEGPKPLVVIAGSLYLASDFLRFQRDGRDIFFKHWNSAREV